MIDQSTPGMGYLARKFLREGRSFEEFSEAQDVWREEFRMCGKYDDWPLDEDGFVARLSLLFGDNEPVERGEGDIFSESGGLAPEAEGGAVTAVPAEESQGPKAWYLVPVAEEAV